MINMPLKICEVCEATGRKRTLWMEESNFCNKCGSRLVFEELEPKVLERIPIPEMTSLILKTIKNIRDSELAEIQKRKEERREVFKDGHNRTSHMVEIDNIQLTMEGTDDRTILSVYEITPEGGKLILQYAVLSAAAKYIWDDLTDILTLNCHINTKLRYFKQFTIRDSCYKNQVIQILSEGGERFAEPSE
jgi:hypothetical protein